MFVSGFQINSAWQDAASSLSHVEDMVSSCECRENSLLVFPEMCTTGFSMDVPAVAENGEDPSYRFFSDLARRQSSTVVAGLPFSHPSGRGVNEAVTFRPDGTELSRYRKSHLFTYANEHLHYLAGDAAPVVFRLGAWTVSVLICYDLRFPETFRSAVDQGAELFLVIANWPTSRLDHWTTLLRARAVENQAYVVGVNRCGEDPHVSYPGASLIVDPKGTILAQADDQPCVLQAELDRSLLLEWREAFPALADRR